MSSALISAPNGAPTTGKPPDWYLSPGESLVPSKVNGQVVTGQQFFRCLPRGGRLRKEVLGQDTAGNPTVRAPRHGTTTMSECPISLGTTAMPCSSRQRRPMGSSQARPKAAQEQVQNDIYSAFQDLLFNKSPVLPDADCERGTRASIERSWKMTFTRSADGWTAHVPATLSRLDWKIPVVTLDPGEPLTSDEYAVKLGELKCQVGQGTLVAHRTTHVPEGSTVPPAGSGARTDVATADQVAASFTETDEARDASGPLESQALRHSGTSFGASLRSGLGAAILWSLRQIGSLAWQGPSRTTRTQDAPPLVPGLSHSTASMAGLPDGAQFTSWPYTELVVDAETLTVPRNHVVDEMSAGAAPYAHTAGVVGDNVTDVLASRAAVSAAAAAADGTLTVAFCGKTPPSGGDGSTMSPAAEECASSTLDPSFASRRLASLSMLMARLRQDSAEELARRKEAEAQRQVSRQMAAYRYGVFANDVIASEMARRLAQSYPAASNTEEPTVEETE